MISLAHISPADCLRRQAQTFAKAQTKSLKVNEAAASEFSVGQTVRTKLNDRGTAAPLVGVVAAIDGHKIMLDNGRTFAARFLTAA